jgi:hypothetical protein
VIPRIGSGGTKKEIFTKTTTEVPDMFIFYAKEQTKASGQKCRIAVALMDM